MATPSEADKAAAQTILAKLALTISEGHEVNVLAQALASIREQMVVDAVSLLMGKAIVFAPLSARESEIWERAANLVRSMLPHA